MELIWDSGTAYEIFTSLYVIHDPSFFGVRPSWAAGVRSRIPAASRELFTQVMDMHKIPICWLYSLPAPKSAAAAVKALESMPSEQVLPNISCVGHEEDHIFLRILERKKVEDSDIEELVDYHKIHYGKKKKVDRKAIVAWCEWWAKADEFGKRFVDGIAEYYENFFREEEKRIEPALKAGLENAKSRAGVLSQEDLLEELSQGIVSDPLFNYDSMILIPSFWLAPLVMRGELDDKTGIMQFCSRPADASLIPGDTVPDSLSAGLRALSDHTRLKILRLIAEKPLTQVEIAKRLRLRAPTINHHLNTLRLASLVTKNIQDDDPKDTRYSIRNGRVEQLCSTIKAFLNPE